MEMVGRKEEAMERTGVMLLILHRLQASFIKRKVILHSRMQKGVSSRQGKGKRAKDFVDSHDYVKAVTSPPFGPKPTPEPGPLLLCTSNLSPMYPSYPLLLNAT